VHSEKHLTLQKFSFKSTHYSACYVFQWNKLNNIIHDNTLYPFFEHFAYGFHDEPKNSTVIPSLGAASASAIFYHHSFGRGGIGNGGCHVCICGAGIGDLL